MLSVGQDHQVDPAEALGITDEIDGDDLPVRDREAEHDPRLPGAHTVNGLVQPA
jgi:hypothetical protein